MSDSDTFGHWMNELPWLANDSYFDGVNCYIRRFSERLDLEVAHNGTGKKFARETMSRVMMTQKLMVFASELAKQADMLYSEKIGPAEFITRVDTIFQEMME